MMTALSEYDRANVRESVRECFQVLFTDVKQAQKKATQKGIFMTQIHEKEEEDDLEAAKALRRENKNTEIVLSSGKRFTLSAKDDESLDTVQSTISNRLRVEFEQATADLAKKRIEFENRMNVCNAKRDGLALKIEQHKKRIKDYSKFINEKEIIRKRAINKYNSENKAKIQKIEEYDQLIAELEEVNRIHKLKSESIQRNKKYKEFLSKVIELLPESYLDAGESKFLSLILRHQTLYESNVDLFENLISNADKLKNLRTELEKLTLDHNSNIMAIGGKLGELQKIKDKYNSANTELQEKIWNESERSKERLIELSRIFWGINNLAEKSVNNKTKPAPNQLATLTTQEKLTAIKNHIVRQAAIVKMIKDSSA